MLERWSVEASVGGRQLTRVRGWGEGTWTRRTTVWGANLGPVPGTARTRIPSQGRSPLALPSWRSERA